MKKFNKILSLLLVFSFLLLSVGCKTSELEKKSADLVNYYIDANYDDVTHTVTASQIVDYINTTETDLNVVCFKLYPTAFSKDAKVLPYTNANKDKCFPNGLSYGDIEISNVKVEDADAEWAIIGEDNNILEVKLFVPLENLKRVKISFDFVLTLANTTHRLGYYDSYVNLGNWYPICCAYQNNQFDMSPYYSTGDPFFSTCANYDVNFTYPNNYIVASTGQLVTTTQAEKITSSYSAKVVRDFALNLGSNYKVLSETVGDTVVSVYCDKDDVNAESHLKTSVDSLNTFNKLFGIYPYKTLNVSFTPFLHGGMEYPNLVFIADDIADIVSINKVIIHEIAHQWWYGIVGNNEITDAWFDESFAEYSTVLFFENNPDYGITKDQLINEAIANYTLYLDVIKSLKLDINTEMNLKLNEYKNEYEYVYMVYIKGMVFVDGLRNKIGDEAFFKGLKLLYENNKYEILDKTKFIEAFNTASGEDITELVETWLGGSVLLEELQAS